MSQELNMNDLEKDLVDLRAMALSGELTEHQTFLALERTESLLEDAKGTPMEETLRVIHCLLSSVWSNVRCVDELKDLSTGLEGIG